MRKIQVRAAPGRGDQCFRGLLLTGPGISDHTATSQDFRQAPIHHLDLAEAAYHHVGGLQVAVDHAAGVGVRHRLGHRREDRQEPGQVVGRGRAACEQVGQGLTLDQLHAEERPSVGERPQLIDRHHAGMLQLPTDLRLLDEPAHQVIVFAEVFAEHLDGDVAAKVGVASLQDGPHAAPSNLAVDPVAERRVIPAGRGPDDRRGFLAEGGVAEKDVRHGPDRGADGSQHRARPVGQVERGAGRLRARPGSVEAQLHQATRAETARKLAAAVGTFRDRHIWGLTTRRS